VHHLTRPQGLARPHVHPRAVGTRGALQQDLHAPARRPAPFQPGRHDAGVVEHQKVAGLQQGRQVGEHEIAQAGARRIDREQPRGGALGQRPLRNELRR
jgi:hypothetical protein